MRWSTSRGSKSDAASSPTWFIATDGDCLSRFRLEQLEDGVLLTQDLLLLLEHLQLPHIHRVQRRQGQVIGFRPGVLAG